MNEILRNPKSVKDMAEQIKLLCDGYWARKITIKEAEDIMHYWGRKEGLKLFQGEEFNSTIVKIIGKKRLALIKKLLEGFRVGM